MKNTEKDPYGDSILLRQLKKRKEQGLSLRVAFLDIDSTLTGNKQATDNVREALKKKGYGEVFVTARTEEMVMTSNSYKSSKKYGFNRPEPHTMLHLGKRIYETPESLIPAQGNLFDPACIVGSTGTAILVKQEGDYYIPDFIFERKLAKDNHWRKKALMLLGRLPDDKLYQLNPIEDEENYTNGITDVYPPAYRIQIHFPTLKAKMKCVKQIKRLIKEEDFNGKLLDDSYPKERNYKVFLLPIAGDKSRAVEYITEKIVKHLKIQKKDLEILIAGDGYPDLRMGLLGGSGTNATFLVVGDARITSALTVRNYAEFAGEKIQELTKKLTKFKSIMQKHEKGKYIYKNIHGERCIIIGDEAYPVTQGPETILAYLSNL